MVAVAVGAASNEEERLQNAGVVLEEVLNVPDNIPRELLEKAECVIVIPSMMKVALGVGGSDGRGAMVCRSGKNFEDNVANEQIYGRKVSARSIVTGRNIDVPVAGRRLVDVLRKNAPRNESTRMTSR
jgi:lipid-binding SYLF domain-containing protein